MLYKGEEVGIYHDQRLKGEHGGCQFPAGRSDGL